MKTKFFPLLLLFGFIAGKAFSQSGEGNTLQVNFKRTKTVIEWQSPKMNDTTMDKSTIRLLAGIISKETITNVEILVNGISEKNVEPTKSINKDLIKIDKTIILKEGQNTIFIVAKTAKESIKSEAKTIFVKKLVNKPIISWLNPIDLETVQELGVINIKACIKSETPVKGIDIYINGKIMRGFVDIKNQKDDCKVMIDKNMNLQPGQNTVYIVASNESGAITSETKTIIKRKPKVKPVITWYNPTENETSLASSAIQIKACIKSAIPVKGVEIYLNGKPILGKVTVESKDANCTVMVDKNIDLKAGKNTIYIVARNESDTAISETKYINYNDEIAKQKRIALIVGNSNYKNAGVLKNPKNDATDITSALKRLSFDVELVSDADYKQLVSCQLLIDG